MLPQAFQHGSDQGGTKKWPLGLDFGGHTGCASAPVHLTRLLPSPHPTSHNGRVMTPFPYMFSPIRPIPLCLVGPPSFIPQARRYGTARWGGALRPLVLVLHLRFIPPRFGDSGQLAHAVTCVCSHLHLSSILQQPHRPPLPLWGAPFCPCSCSGCLLRVYGGGDRGGEGSRCWLVLEFFLFFPFLG